jgi:DNA-binding SARP family transcriptional activator/Tfp pilus assembly protein PilF
MTIRGATRPASELRIHLLGPFEVVADGSAIVVGGIRQAKLLAILALNHGVMVPYERIAEALWDSAPTSVRQQTHNSIRRLRAALEDRTDVKIATVHGGYALEVSPRTLDLVEFDEAIRKSEVAEASGAIQDAATEVATALGVWRGPALGGIDGRYIRSLAARLDERQILAIERLASLHLKLGSGASAIGDLTAAMADYPFRESLRAALMLALQQGGRQTEALAVYEQGRKLLAAELGLDPGPVLREAHATVLRGSDLIRMPDRPVPNPPEAPAPARFLPRDTAEFTGRSAEVARVLLAARQEPARPLVISSIEGMGGVGKTALAVHAAHQLADDYPDGHYFVDLHGYSPGAEPVLPTAALETLLSESGVPVELLPAQLEARSAQWRSRLAGKRALVVIDNAYDESQVRDLLPAAGDALVLITSRRRLTALEGNRPLLLEVLSPAEGIELFVAIAGDDRTGGRHAEVAEVVERCGRLPLAIRIAAARFRDRQTWRLPDLLDQLRTHERRTRFLAVGDRSVMAALQMSYVHLSPRQQRIFRLLSLNPAAEVDAPAAAALTATSVAEAESCLEELLECSLLIQHTAGRYEFHDLVRDCSSQLRTENDSAEEQHTAMHRLLDYLLYAAHRCCERMAIGPFLFEPQILHQPNMQLPLATDAERASFLRQNYRGLMAAIRYAQDEGWTSHAWQLPCALIPFLSGLNYNNESFDIFARARSAAATLGDRHGEVAALMALAVVCRDRGNNGAAQDLFQQAIEVSKLTGNVTWQAQLLTDLGVSQLNEGQVRPADDSFSRAYGMARELGDERLSLALTNNLGVVCREMGRLDDSLTYFATVAEQLGDDSRERAGITNLINFGIVYHLQGRLDEAEASLVRALEVSIRTAAERRQANIRCFLSSVHRSRGEVAVAVAQGRTALSLARRFALNETECMALNTLGEAFVTAGELTTARIVYGEAVGAAERYGFVVQLARAYEGFAHVSLATGETEAAGRAWRRALDLYPDGVAAADYAARHLVMLGQAQGDCPRCATASPRRIQ